MSQEVKVKVKTIAKVNNIAIQVDHESIEKWVPVRPICEALGVSLQKQLEKINEHPILSSTVTLRVTVAADEKDRNMQCLPIQFVFGWLFTIHPNNVNEEARDALIRYQLECYNALFLYFTEKSNYLSEKQILIDEKIEAYQAIQKDFKTAKDRLSEAKKALDDARRFSFDDWKAKYLQQEIPFPENP